MEEEYFLTTSGQGYLEGLIKSRQHLSDRTDLLTRLDDVIELEIELALMGAEKAYREIIKFNKAPIVPIK